MAADPGIYIYPAQATPAEEAAARADMESAAPTDEPQPAGEHASRAGFDWPSAGIGTAAGGLLLTVMLAAAFGVGRRERHTARA